MVPTRVTVALDVLAALRQAGLVVAEPVVWTNAEASLVEAVRGFRWDPIALAVDAAASVDERFGARRFWQRPDAVMDDDEYVEVLTEAANATGEEWTDLAATAHRVTVDGRVRIRVEATCSPENFAGDYDPQFGNHLDYRFLNDIERFAEQHLSGRFVYCDEDMLYLPVPVIEQLRTLADRLPGEDDVVDLLDATRDDPRQSGPAWGFIFEPSFGDGRRIEEPAPDGRWPLVVAASYGLDAQTRMLLEHGAAEPFVQRSRPGPATVRRDAPAVVRQIVADWLRKGER